MSRIIEFVLLFLFSLAQDPASSDSEGGGPKVSLMETGYAISYENFHIKNIDKQRAPSKCTTR